MQTVIIVIHLMVVVALVGVILVQKSEGGGLGIGGGSGFMTARGAANVLTRTTAILAAIFFATSLGLSLIARYGAHPLDILNQAPPQTQGEPGAPATSGKGILDQLGGKPGQPAPTKPAPASPPSSSTNEPQTAPAQAPAKPAAEAPANETPKAPAAGGQPQVPNQ